MENNNLEKLIEELKAVTPLKKTTEVGDIVLVVSENPQLLLYGLVGSIERDPSKKDEWWNIGLTFLTVPLQQVVWTLRTAQMTGQEIFTMGGEKRFVQAVSIGIVSNEDPKRTPPEPKKSSPKGTLKRVK